METYGGIQTHPEVHHQVLLKKDGAGRTGEWSADEILSLTAKDLRHSTASSRAENDAGLFQTPQNEQIVFFFLF